MKCKFWNDCELYDENSKSCKDKGIYYSEEGITKMRPAACYVRMEEEKHEMSTMQKRNKG